MVFPFIGIIPRSIVPPRFPHVVANGKVLFLFFLQLNYIPLYGHYVSLCIHLLTDTWAASIAGLS